MYDDWAQREVEKWKKAEEEKKKNSDNHLRDLADTSILVERAEMVKTADDPDMDSLAGVSRTWCIKWRVLFADNCRSTFVRMLLGAEPASIYAVPSVVTQKIARLLMAKCPLSALIRGFIAFSTRKHHISTLMPTLFLRYSALMKCKLTTMQSNALCSRILSDSSDFLALTYPGTGDLRTTYKGDFNDRILSYQCFKNDSSVGTYPDNETKTGIEVGME